ncbi:hypothetical protein R0J92_25140, partial [Tritonibacter sp. SIMBA_163]
EDYNAKTDSYYKYNYTKNDDVIDIQFDSKQEVFLKRNWEEVTPEEVTNQLNAKDQQISDLTTKLSAKEDLESKFNSASEKLV